MRPPVVHLRSLRLYVNAGMNFPACYARAERLDLDKGRLPSTPWVDEVSCRRCVAVVRAADAAEARVRARRYGAARYSPAWVSYVRAIRNPAKRGYAQAYARFRSGEGLDHEPDRGILSVMAAQAVRMNWDKMMGGGR